MNEGPTSSGGRKQRIQIMKKSSTYTSSMPIDMPDLSGMPSTGSG